MGSKLQVVVLLTLGMAAAAAQGTDIGHGKSLHRENCTTCHTSLTGGDPDGLYTRPNRRIGSLGSLKTQVRRCEVSQGLQWFDEDVNDVTTYLNKTFYKFNDG